MNSSIGSSRSVKTLPCRSRSAYPVPRIRNIYCERGLSNDAPGKQRLCLHQKNLTNCSAEGDKANEQENTESKLYQNPSFLEALNPDIKATEIKKFQRNVIYALNRLMKQAEMESEEEFQRMNGLPVW